MVNAVLGGGPAIDVAVIGGGPAGLAAATALKEAGQSRVVVLEREPQAGGIPRHCGHYPFGMSEFSRVLKGPDYAARLVGRAQKTGVEIHTATTVIAARPGGDLLIATPTETGDVTAQRVIYATGVRETPRSARLISGARVRGVMNTGALQSMVYLKDRRPFRRPIIVGSELVAMSAIMTCRHAGIRPVAMVEPSPSVKAPWPSAFYPSLKGVRLITGTRLIRIDGEKSVESVLLQDHNGQTNRIACDGVILSGDFTPEAALARCGHLEVDPATGGPRVDQWGRCSDPAYFATGNLLRPVETAGWSWREGCRTGRWVARDLAEGLPRADKSLSVMIRDARLKYAMPQTIVLTDVRSGMRHLQLRVSETVKGELIARDGNGAFWRRRINVGPERRLLVPIAEIVAGGEHREARFDIAIGPD